MIQKTATIRDIPRTHFAPQARTVQVHEIWQRLADGWMRAMGAGELERRITAEVNFQIRRRPEPGDVILVNRIVEDMLR
jgi:hypothetical protein